MTATIPDTSPLPGADNPPTTPETSALRLGDLPNHLHLIFREGNFHPEVDHPLLRPALLLASRFLSTDSLLHFWHAAFFSKVRRIRGSTLSREDRPPFELAVGRESNLTTAQTKRTKRALVRFASRVKFVPAHNGGAVRFRAAGKICAILIPDADLTNPRNFAATDRDKYLWSTFELAIAILHQLAHAVMHGSRGRAAHYYFRDTNLAEHGYEWEASVFGGVITYVPDDNKSTFHSHISLLSWPGSMLTASQGVHGNAIGLRGRPMPFDMKGELVGHVPFVHIESMFSRSFWERVAHEGRAVLAPSVTSWGRWRVPKGWRTKLQLE